MEQVLAQFGKPHGIVGAAISHAMRYVHAEFYDYAIDRVSLVRGSRLVELGCGASDVSERVRPFGVRYIGVDHSPDVVAAAADVYPDSVFRCQDAGEALPVCESVMAVNLLQWIAAPAAVFLSVRRALVPDGRFVIGIPDATCERLMKPAGVTHRTCEELRVLFHDAGFFDVTVEVHETTFIRYMIGRGVA